MEPTTYQIMAKDYHSKWCACLETIQKQNQEIDRLREELTEDRRERYRLLDRISERTETGS